MHLDGVSEDGVRIRGQGVLNLNGGGERGPQQGQRFFDQQMELHWTTLSHGAAAEGEDLLHQLFGTFARSEHILKILPSYTVLWYLAGCNLRETQDGRQDV